MCIDISLTLQISCALSQRTPSLITEGSYNIITFAVLQQHENTIHAIVNLFPTHALSIIWVKWKIQPQLVPMGAREVLSVQNFLVGELLFVGSKAEAAACLSEAHRKLPAGLLSVSGKLMKSLHQPFQIAAAEEYVCDGNVNILPQYLDYMEMNYVQSYLT